MAAYTSLSNRISKLILQEQKHAIYNRIMMDNDINISLCVIYWFVGPHHLINVYLSDLQLHSYVFSLVEMKIEIHIGYIFIKRECQGKIFRIIFLQYIWRVGFSALMHFSVFISFSILNTKYVQEVIPNRKSMSKLT